MQQREEATRSWRRRRAGVLAALAVASVLGAAAAGCGSSDDADRGKTSAAQKPTAGAEVKGTLEFWDAGTAPTVAKWWKAFIKDFEVKYPGTNVNMTTFATEEFRTKYLAAFSSGSEPDVYESDTGELLERFVRVGKIADISKLIDFDGYNPASLAPVTTDEGAIHGAPDYWFVMSMFGNRDLFEQHGVEQPKTWDDLLAACKTFSDAGVIPIALGNGGADQWTAVQWYDALLYQYTGNVVGVDATLGTNGASFTDPEFAKAAQRFRELVDAKCFPDGFTGLKYQQMSTLFISGKAAMNFTGSWFAGEIAAGEPNFEVDVFPLPDAPDAEHSTADLEGVMGGVSVIAATQKGVDANPALVAAFLQEFAAQVDDYANAGDQLSVALKPNPTGGPVQKDLTAMLADVGELVTFTGLVTHSSMIDDWDANTQALTQGEKSPEEFAQAMADAAERERPNFTKD
jgi:raffinose/stachyose/melibiose transport system substrate-binding protein